MRCLQIGWLLGLGLAAGLVGCGSTEEVRESVGFKGIVLSMRELAKDGEFELHPGETHRKVDVGSTLRLHFETPELRAAAAQSPGWRVLTTAIRDFQAAHADYERLATRAAQLTGPNAPRDDQFIADSDALNSRVIGTLQAITGADEDGGLMTRDELSTLMSEHFEAPFQALIEDLNRRRDQLHRNAAMLMEGADRYEVVLRAKRVPVGGKPQPLHIPGYDKLPEGDYQNLDPIGLIPSPREMDRLKSELEGARKVADAIKEVRESGDSITDAVENMLHNVRDQLRALEDRLKSSEWRALVRRWQDVLSDDFLAKVEALEGGSAITGPLGKVRDDLATVQGLVDQVERFRELLNGRSLLDPVAFASGSGLLADVGGFVEGVTALAASIGEWPGRFSAIAGGIGGVVVAAGEAEVAPLLVEIRDGFSGSLADMRSALAADLPKTVTALQVVVTFLGNGTRDFLVASDDLGATPPYVIPRPLEDLADADLDLHYSGALPGDRVEFSVDFRESGNDQERGPDYVYRTEVTHAGWHNRFSGDVIFSRTMTGPSSNAFRTTVAASSELHHFDRESPDGVINWLDPGIGLHAAFLDQDAGQNSELGAGVNMSLWNGLVRVGYGYNVSADDHQDYWFFGFGLFSVLNRFRDAGSDLFDG